MCSSDCNLCRDLLRTSADLDIAKNSGQPHLPLAEKSLMKCWITGGGMTYPARHREPLLSCTSLERAPAMLSSRMPRPAAAPMFSASSIPFSDWKAMPTHCPWPLNAGPPLLPPARGKPHDAAHTAADSADFSACSLACA